jgi:hypothetical protein
MASAKNRPNSLSAPFMAALTLLGLPAAKAAYPDLILSNNPVAYYRLEEVSGATAFDDSANHFDASFIFNQGYPQLALLTYPFGSLQATPSATGTYTNVPGATSPFTTTLSGPRKYFRLLLQ